MVHIVKANGEFRAIVHAALARTRISELLASCSAVALERIARGGGATNWFYCRGLMGLEGVEGMLSSGSVVSFYFDDRIRMSPTSPQLSAEIEKIIEVTGDAVVGVIRGAGV